MAGVGTETETTAFLVTMSEENKEEIDKLADELGMSTNEFVTIALQFIGRAYDRKLEGPRKRGGNRRESGKVNKGSKEGLSDMQAIKLAASVIKNASTEG